MSAYVKFVCDYCGGNEIEIELENDIEDPNSIEYAILLLWELGWGTFDGHTCRPCNV